MIKLKSIHRFHVISDLRFSKTFQPPPTFDSLTLTCDLQSLPLTLTLVTLTYDFFRQ